ncbi:MAG TPA: polysaccharide deacetylase family protein [Solirubrobacteraceae bacterium]
MDRQPPRHLDPERLRARREGLRAQRARRRRLLAVGALAAVIIAVAVVVALAGGGSSGGPGHRSVARGGARKRAAAGASGSGAASVGGTRGSAKPQAAPILMYHVINPPPPGAPFPGLYVEPEEFAEQMHALAHAGYHAVTMDQLWANWHEGAALPAGKPIVVSFDNGYQSQYSQALPVLRGLGWVGVESIQLTGLPPSQGGISPAQVRGLVAAGWELDTQGFSHADLITLDASALHYQVAVARETVKRLYDVPVNWFCYPSGHYDATVVAAVQAAGYRGSTTVVSGWAHPSSDPDRLPRLRVLGGTSGAQLLSEIAAVHGEAPPPESYSG